jgi:RHS repeat-associated protein
MGNRQKTVKNLLDTSFYSFSSSASSNRLTSFSENNTPKYYHYDGIGAVDVIAKLNGIDTVLKEQFAYQSSGRVKFYTKTTNALFLYPCMSFPFTRTFNNSYKWQYRNSPLGDREQKRLLYSPHGDSVCNTNKYYHDWTYYLLEPGGEQLAVYNGVQVSNSDTLNHTGRRVYMYAHSYISAGGSLITLSDTTKQYNIFDNLGSCRSVISVKGLDLDIQSIDYKPFGDTLNSTTESRIGYIGKERDKENSYFAMGMRQYDCTTGRFLSVDPYFEKFREQTPYQYAFNNPISFKDPTGLEPESEKGGEDRMLWALIKEDIAVFQVAASLASKAEEDEKRFQAMRQMINDIFDEIAMKKAIGDYKWGVLSRAYGGGGGGGASGGGRTGDAGENGNKEKEKNSDFRNKSKEFLIQYKSIFDALRFLFKQIKGEVGLEIMKREDGSFGLGDLYISSNDKQNSIDYSIFKSKYFVDGLLIGFIHLHPGTGDLTTDQLFSPEDFEQMSSFSQYGKNEYNQFLFILAFSESQTYYELQINNRNNFNSWMDKNYYNYDPDQFPQPLHPNNPYKYNDWIFRNINNSSWGSIRRR